MTVFGLGRESASKPGVLAVAALLVLGFFLGLYSGRWMGPMQGSGADLNASEMEEAVRSAMLKIGTFDRSTALGKALAGLDAENVKGAARGMRTRSEYLDPIDLQLFLSAWTRFDPAAAMYEADSWPSKTGREIGLRIVMREWAASGRVIEAGSYYESIDNLAAKSIVAGPLIRGWALSGDIEGALMRVRLLWEQGEPVNTVDGFVRGALSSVGPTELIERVLALDPNHGGEFERRLMRLSFKLGARENPRAAAVAYVRLENDPPPEWLKGVLQKITGPWAESEPATAIEWLLERVDTPERNLALKETMRIWAVRDFDDAWNWWRAQDQRRDLAVEEGGGLLRTILLPPLLRRMARVRPVEASEWVEEVEQSVAREALILRIAYFWAYRDRLQAERWIEGLGLSESLSENAAEAIARGSEDRKATKASEGPA